MAKRKSESSARGKRAKKSAKSTDKDIDFSDIPELSSRQLKKMKKVGRPTLGKSNRQLIAIRLDPEVLSRLRKIAEKKGTGYQTLINEILQKYIDNKSA